MSVASKQRSSTVKVGILTLVSLALLVFTLIWLRGRGLSGGDHYDVPFKDVNGLREGSAVQMMGIRVGFVDSIKPFKDNERYYVMVSFNINKDLGIKIPEGSKLSIEQSGIIGEQFVEITPPQLREVTLTTFREPAKEITAGIPVKFLYEEGYMAVGRVEKVEPYRDGNLVRHRLYYRITRAGAEMPDDPLFELTLDQRGEYYLRILPREPMVAQAPDPHLKFTVEEPMRMKRFLEIQMESAEALKTTNQKLNQLLSEETIATLQSTLKNTEVLTARANEVMDNANHLFATTQNDLDRLASVSESLANNVSTVSSNINDIIGNPKLKGELTSTVASLRESSNAMRDLLNDPALRQTVSLTRDTAQNANDLVASLKRVAGDPQLNSRVQNIVTNMDTSLDKLNDVLETVDESIDHKDEKLKGTMEDIRATAKNLRTLTGKFSGHFTLWKLLF